MDSVARVQFWDLVEKMIKTKKMDLLKWRVCGRKQEDETFRNHSKRQVLMAITRIGSFWRRKKQLFQVTNNTLFSLDNSTQIVLK